MLRGHPQQKPTMPDDGKNSKNQQSRANYPAAPMEVEEIDAATEILLSGLEEYLSNKRFTTIDEDVELFFLKDPTTRLHASRIAELHCKEDKNALEQHEYNLYLDKKTRAYAYRIMELTNKENPTPIEEHELRWLNNAILRPYTKQFLELYNKKHDELTPKEQRTLKLLLNPKTIRHANEIVELEALNSLDDEQTRDLSIDYLSKIVEISCLSTTDFHKNYRSSSNNPSADCVTRDARLDTYSPEVAKFRAIEDAFNASAKKLIDSYKRQIFRNTPSIEDASTAAQLIEYYKRLANNQNKPIGGQSLFASESPKVTSIFQARQNTLALALEKLFFENDIPFSQKNLDNFTNYFHDLVINQKLIFNTDNFKELYRLLCCNLIDVKAETNEPEERPTYASGPR